jgi:hypothetical protein
MGDRLGIHSAVDILFVVSLKGLLVCQS